MRRGLVPILVLAMLTGCRRPPPAVTGTVALAQDADPPTEAVLEVALLEQPRVDTASGLAHPDGGPKPRVMGMTMIGGPGVPPYRFRIPFDPRLIDSTRAYVIRARIVRGSRVLFVASEPARVITGRRPTEVRILLSPVPDAAPPPPP